MTSLRPHHADMKVICLGLGRTGTTSMLEALQMLGFGPCYHMSVILGSQGNDFPAWFDIGDGYSTPQAFDQVFRGYHSVLDYPAAMYPAKLYAAYPNAKFILTVRDPVKWEKSVKATLLPFVDAACAKRVKGPGDEYAARWGQEYMKERYHQGRLESNAQQEISDHNARVRRIIPDDKLLIYEVGEGWERLVEFLEVPKPTEPFPHVNDTEAFKERISQMSQI